MCARIIALGQPAAGDDGVGLAVLERLRASVPGGVELCVAADATDLLALLATPSPVVLVDALLGEPAGEIREVAPEALDARSATAVSSHGLGIGEAIATARALYPETIAPRISVVAVVIGRPSSCRKGLSPRVAAAVDGAAALAISLAGRSIAVTTL
jgi:hydrogenase maturation protease